MHIAAGVAGLLLVFVVLRDAFETIVLPRRVSGRVRVSKVFYQVTWKPWAAIGRRMTNGERRESYLSTYGPLSLLDLIGLRGAILVSPFALVPSPPSLPFTPPFSASYPPT